MTEPTTTELLAAAVARLPRPLSAAMLAAVTRERIITGAYADGHGMCPLLGAHRYGVRENGPGFAEAWDRFCGSRRGKRRDATDAERALLIGLLKASLFGHHGGAKRPAPPPAPLPDRLPTPPQVAERLIEAGT
ncbi:hypothetical protein OM076_20155 [Solirubrobacter ginsenosidimutans]|uniref:Uncharacterized protein n=1 Tax=Solirubrobacter ginsenosidimutans TaxID=490573 RepID=A0A9X3S6D0_9ACTN|nr:hypothetical protein [Solirubrobacter ginsenosidimutans]MDA0162598.1 hypothetical protein [Solirubrobacter ginsenosidimutans]